MPVTKNPAAVSLGRKGGLKGGPARAANLTPAQRSESARKAVQARWARVKAQRNSTQVQEADSSDATLLSLLEKVKASSDPAEIRGLVERIEKVVFHKQMKNA